MTSMRLWAFLAGAVLLSPSPASGLDLQALRERVPDSDVPTAGVQAAEAPAIDESGAVPLTPDQEAILIEASMVLEKDLVAGLRKQALEWRRTYDSEQVEELMKARLQELSSQGRFKSLFAIASAQAPGAGIVHDRTVDAYLSRARQGTDPVVNPSREQIAQQLKAQAQDSAGVESAESAQEVYDGHKEAFVKVCRAFEGVDKQAQGFPRAILGILHAETHFGKGCDRARSATCGTPSPVRHAMNGAQRNAAFRIGAKKMFGSWAATTAPSSGAGAAGLCQFLPGTAEQHLKAYQRQFGGDAPNLFSFDGCIPMIALYLKDYLDSGAGRRRPGIENAVRAYNGGAGFKANNRQTRGYHQKVTASMRAQTGVPQTCQEVLQSAGR